MTQVSRPLLMVLAATIVVALLWVVVLAPHPSNGSAPTSPRRATAPGVAGLSNAIAKARGAVASSQGNAGQLESQSAAASTSGAPAAGGTPAAGAGATGTPAIGARPVGARRAGVPAAGTRPAAAPAKSPAPVDRSAALLSALRSGKVGVLLFWNPRSSDDRAVRAALERLGRRDGGVYVRAASVDQVADFGPITRGVSVAQSPTVLVIDRRGGATRIAGLADTREIQQAVGDAVRAAQSTR